MILNTLSKIVFCDEIIEKLRLKGIKKEPENIGTEPPFLVDVTFATVEDEKAFLRELDMKIYVANCDYSFSGRARESTAHYIDREFKHLQHMRLCKLAKCMYYDKDYDACMYDRLESMHDKITGACKVITPGVYTCPDCMYVNRRCATCERTAHLIENLLKK